MKLKNPANVTRASSTYHIDANTTIEIKDKFWNDATNKMVAELKELVAKGKLVIVAEPVAEPIVVAEAAKPVARARPIHVPTPRKPVVEVVKEEPTPSV